MKELIQDLIKRYDALLLQTKVPPTAYYKSLGEYRQEIKDKKAELEKMIKTKNN